MNPMVVVLLGFAAFAAASPQWGHGPVADTPEVAAAKAAHFAAVARAQAPSQPAWNGAPAQNWNAAPAQSWNGAWNGAPAQSWNAQEDDGQWRDDTRLYDQGNSVQQWNGAAQEDDGQWRDDSHLYDNGNGSPQWNGPSQVPQQQWAAPQPQWAPQPQPQWGAPQAPAVHGETPEVAAARQAHLAAHAAASRRYKRGIHAVAVSPIVGHSVVSHSVVSPVVSHSIVSPVVHAPLVHHSPLVAAHSIW